MENVQNTPTLSEINEEVLEHMMNPKNYGKMDNANGIGMGSDKKTGEFAMVYVNIQNDIMENITFGCNACQDTVVAGSLFTEMVKGDTLENSIKALRLMDEKLLDKRVSKKQRLCSSMVLQSFRAAVINYENRQKDMDEEMFTIDLKESCEGLENETK